MTEASKVAGEEAIDDVDLFAMSSFSARRVELIVSSPPDAYRLPPSPGACVRRAEAAFVPLECNIASAEIPVFLAADWMTGTGCGARLVSACEFNGGPRPLRNEA